MGNKMLCLFIFIATLVAHANAKNTWDVIWKYGSDYSGWPIESNFGFRLGDELVFKYKPGEHNVIEVDEESYNECIIPPNAKILDTGNDVIHITSGGKRWFICGVGEGKHCKEGGMKLQIDVNPPYDTEDHDVGDRYGWAPGVDYASWALNEVFDPKDKLIFNYKKGEHNVLKVDEAAYKDCIIPKDQSKALTSGSDEVILEEIGPHWFISGIGKDCQNGMKLYVWVMCPDLKPKPPPKPPVQGGRKLDP